MAAGKSASRASRISGRTCGCSACGDRRTRVSREAERASPSKAALATNLEALRNRLAQHGVTVVTVKPGPTATEMTAHLHWRMMDPPTVARVILRRSHRSGEYYVRFVDLVAFAVIRRIPGLLFRRLGI